MQATNNGLHPFVFHYLEASIVLASFIFQHSERERTMTTTITSLTTNFRRAAQRINEHLMLEDFVSALQVVDQYAGPWKQELTKLLPDTTIEPEDLAWIRTKEDLIRNARIIKPANRCWNQLSLNELDQAFWEALEKEDLLTAAKVAGALRLKLGSAKSYFNLVISHPEGKRFAWMAKY